MNAKAAMLEVDALTVDRGPTRVVDRASFRAERGEVVAIVGPNGAGKTTLLEAVVGLRRGQGSVTFDQVTLASFRARAEVFAYMPDEASLPEEASVATILLGASPDPARREREARRFGIQSLLDRGGRELSRGEAKRVWLAQTVLLDRPVLYGDRYAEFLDGVKAFAFFPLAIRKEAPPAGDIRLSVRFYPIAGKIDQAAGIAFGVAPDGSYLGVRANALEDNILYFKVVKGKRTVFDTVRNVPTPTRTWHTLVVELRGKQLSVRLDDTKRFEKTLDAVPAGHVGLWSKADSQVLFDDFDVTRL